MTRNISSTMLAHVREELTNLATLWKVTRTDGQVFSFTDHDQTIEYDGSTYQAASGFIPASLAQKDDLSVSNIEAFSFLDSSKITAADIEAGLFDYADLDIYMVNYENTTGCIILAEGWKLGEIQLRDNDFTVDVRSKTLLLQQNIVDLYSQTCRVELASTFCHIDLSSDGSSHWSKGSVTSISATYPRSKFSDTDSRSETSDVFQYGVLTWSSSGAGNYPYTMEVKNYDPTSNVFELFQDMPSDISTGDKYSVTWGCNHSFNHCSSRYGNSTNFRGEPYIIGTDKMMDYPT